MGDDAVQCVYYVRLLFFFDKSRSMETERESGGGSILVPIPVETETDELLNKKSTNLNHSFSCCNQK